MQHLRRYTDATDEAQRAACELNSRPAVEQTPQDIVDAIMAKLSNADMDRKAGRYASAAQFEAEARAMARQFKGV